MLSIDEIKEFMDDMDNEDIEELISYGESIIEARKTKVKKHKRAVKDSWGRIIGYITINPHIRTRPTTRLSLRRRKKK